MVNGRLEGSILTILLEGRIDSSSSAQAEQRIMELVSGNSHEQTVLDALKLEYISSAGLRVILRLRKAEPGLRIVNTSPEVYEIFDMTGFTEMMQIEKAYRCLSVDGCEAIGQGANGTVYRLDEETIVKVYRNPDSLSDIHRERALARTAFVLGIPTAIPYDVVKVGNSYGSVFELLNAKSFAELIAAAPEKLDAYIQLSVDVLKKIHGTGIAPDTVPQVKGIVLSWVDFLEGYLPQEQYQKLYRLIDGIPDELHMLHGDYHIKNIMMQNGEVLLIDMDTLCTGHPIFEFAFMYLTYVGYSEDDPGDSMRFLGIPHETAVQIWEKTISAYFETEDTEKLSHIADRAMLIGYARLLQRTLRRRAQETPDVRKRIASCEKHLTELLERVDSIC